MRKGKGKIVQQRRVNEWKKSSGFLLQLWRGWTGKAFETLNQKPERKKVGSIGRNFLKEEQRHRLKFDTSVSHTSISLFRISARRMFVMTRF
jgi:hypothetical protein